MPDKQQSPSWLSVGVVTALAFALRVPGLATQSLWYDEIYSLNMTQWPTWVILTVRDGHPPLYNLLLIGLVPLLGEQAGRVLSVILGLATLPLFMLLAARLFDRRTAVWAGLLLAISPLHVWYSREGRMYALYVLMTILSSLALERVIRKGQWRNYVGWGLATLVGLLTHYGYAAVLLAQILFGTGVVVRKRGVVGLAPVLLIGLVGACVMIPLARELALGPLGVERGFELFALPYAALAFLFGLGIGPSLTDLHWSRSLETLQPYAPELGIAALLLLVVAVTVVRNLRTMGAWGFYLVLWLAVPPLLLQARSAIAGTSANVRYVIGALPAFLLLAAFALARQKAPAAIASAGLIAALSLMSMYRSVFDPHYQREQMREAVHYLDENFEPGDHIAVSGSSQRLTFHHYFGHDRFEAAKIPIRPVLGPQDAAASIERWLEASPRTWVLLSREWDEDPGHHLRNGLLARRPDALRADLSGVDVFVVER